MPSPTELEQEALAAGLSAEAAVLFAAFRLPPAEAIEYFESKGYEISWHWWDTWQEAHAKAFTVAKATRMDVLQSIRNEAQSALDAGTTERAFIQTLEPRLRKLGWWGKKTVINEGGNEERVQLGSHRRLRKIYRINLQTAYMAGRWKRQMENADSRPYWQYVAVLDSRTRPEHRILHGKVFRYDDPFWEKFYPPNGWNCRCRVRARSQASLDRDGLVPESSAGKIGEETRKIGVDKRTGEEIHKPVATYQLPDGSTFRTDAGWSYNPGEAWYPELRKYDPDIARAFQK